MTFLTPPADTNDTTPAFSGDAGDVTGDTGTVTVKVYSGADLSGSLLQTLDAQTSAPGCDVDDRRVPRAMGEHLHRQADLRTRAATEHITAAARRRTSAPVRRPRIGTRREGAPNPADRHRLYDDDHRDFFHRSVQVKVDSGTVTRAADHRTLRHPNHVMDMGLPLRAGGPAWAWAARRWRRQHQPGRATPRWLVVDTTCTPAWSSPPPTTAPPTSAPPALSGGNSTSVNTTSM